MTPNMVDAAPRQWKRTGHGEFPDGRLPSSNLSRQNENQANVPRMDKIFSHEPNTPLSDADRRALKTLGLDADADRRSLRQRYSELVRRYHPDRNGGDRAHEKKLQQVIDAYTLLKKAPAFA